MHSDNFYVSVDVFRLCSHKVIIVHCYSWLLCTLCNHCYPLPLLCLPSPPLFLPSLVLKSYMIQFYLLFQYINCAFLKKDFLYLLFRERWREGEKHQCAKETSVASCTHPTGDLACDWGMCPDLVSNGGILLCGATPNPLSNPVMARLYKELLQLNNKNNQIKNKNGIE